MANVPSRVVELVETFEQHVEAYRSQQYNETQLRREFIDPFFEELGWDVTNKAGYAQAYKDVIHEYSIKVGGATEAPDYCFRIGGVRKFFLEAKKPSVDIKGDPHPAYQLRRYAWSAKLPLSVLTDFEEFAVYDCLTRPKYTDKADVARIILFSYKDYLKKWPEIADIFSKEAVLKGSFDKFAAATKGKRGTSTVDKEFLAEIEKWRSMLARIIALRNGTLSIREINFAVQRTIDRILFLRMCEDRGIELYGQLQAISSGERTYPRLCEVFERADQRYNSGLFHFHDEPDRTEPPDEMTPKLIIDDKDLKWILHSLYYPQSPYEFSVLPAEILGNVYEQFLGKVITLTSGHRASVEDKPEVKKAGGVYYTPSYIVDYIVKNTVGRLLGDPVIPNEPLALSAIEGAAEESVQTCHSERSEESRSSSVNRNSKCGNLKSLTLKQVSNIKILDPACGSGSFLIGAYQYLLDWHLMYYTQNDPEKHAKGRAPKICQATACHSERIEESRSDSYRLTIVEKKRILLSSIFGVDIDSQAVEVTKLSLLLKVLEGESSETIENQYRLFHERALPDLAANIKCGNSLIGPDFFETIDPASITEELQQKINAFDWQAEFPEIFNRQNPGFDAVIGNPPYVRQETIKEFKKFFQLHYDVYHASADLYAYFIEKAVTLLRNGGYFSYIVANKWLRANYGEPLRSWLKKQRIEQIIDFGDLPVFKAATTYPCIIVLNKNVPNPDFFVTNVHSLDFQSLSDYVAVNRFPVVQSCLDEKGWSLTDENNQRLLEKLYQRSIPLEKYVKSRIYRGILTGLNDAFVIDKETRDALIKSDKKNEELIKPFLLGRDVKRYRSIESERFLIFMPCGWTKQHLESKKNAWSWFKSEYPSIAEHLEPFATAGEKRCDKGQYWWELRACDFYSEFEEPKIIVPTIANRSSYVLDRQNFFSNDKTSIIVSGDLYLLGLLNSKVLDFVLKSIASTKRGGYYEYKPMYISKLPIRLLNFDIMEERAQYDRIAQLVKRAMDLHKELAAAKVPDEKTRVQRQIDATDKQIDQLVYNLYGLTEEEIKIIEGSHL